MAASRVTHLRPESTLIAPPVVGSTALRGSGGAKRLQSGAPASTTFSSSPGGDEEMERSGSKRPRPHEHAGGVGGSEEPINHYDDGTASSHTDHGAVGGRRQTEDESAPLSSATNAPSLGEGGGDGGGGSTVKKRRPSTFGVKLPPPQLGQQATPSAPRAPPHGFLSGLSSISTDVGSSAAAGAGGSTSTAAAATPAATATAPSLLVDYDSDDSE